MLLIMHASKNHFYQLTNQSCVNYDNILTEAPFFNHLIVGIGLPVATQGQYRSLPISFSVSLICSTHSGEAEK